MGHEPEAEEQCGDDQQDGQVLFIEGLQPEKLIYRDEQHQVIQERRQACGDGRAVYAEMRDEDHLQYQDDCREQDEKKSAPAVFVGVKQDRSVESRRHVYERSHADDQHHHLPLPVFIRQKPQQRMDVRVDVEEKESADEKHVER